MIVRAAADDAEAVRSERRGERLRVLHDLALIILELGLHRFEEADGLGGDDVHERAALDAGQHPRVDVLRVFRLAQDQTRRAGRATSCASSS